MEMALALRPSITGLVLYSSFFLAIISSLCLMTSSAESFISLEYVMLLASMVCFAPGR